MTLEEQIKQVGIRAGARVVGIASAAAFRETVPEGYRPEDILPGAGPSSSRAETGLPRAPGAVPTTA